LLNAEQAKDAAVRNIYDTMQVPEEKFNIPREGEAIYAARSGDTSALPRRAADMVQEGVIPKGIRDMARDAAQRGYILDLLMDQFGLDPQDDKFQIEKTGSDGETYTEFDPEAWDEAVDEVATTSPAAYAEIHRELSMLGGEPGVGPLARGITAEDFRYHARDKNAFQRELNDEKKADKDPIYNMPTDTEEQRVDKSIAIAAWEQKWDDSFGKTYTDDEDGTYTAEQHSFYDNAGYAVSDYVYSLSPADKAAFKEQYPDAFDKDGKFVRDQLTTEQLREITNQQGLMGGGTGALPEEVEPYTQDAIVAEDAWELQNQFFDGEYLTPEQKAALDAYSEYTDTYPELEAQARKMREMMGAGTPWKDVLALANGELAAYINGRMDRTGAAAKTGAYDAQDAFFNGLSSEQQQLLIDEGSSTFDRYAEASTGPISPSGGGTTSRSGSTSTYAGSGGSSGGGRSEGDGTRPPPGAGGGGGAGGSRVGGYAPGAPALGGGAVALPPHMQQLLAMLSQNLPPEQVQMLLRMLQNYYMRQSGGPGTSPGPKGPRPRERSSMAAG
jgi:hypothetical protein